MKLQIETGRESHSTSEAWLSVKYYSGEFAGKHLYEVRGRHVTSRFLEATRNSRWQESVYDLPAGTEIEIIGRGRTGPRGVNKFEVHRVYRVDPEAEVAEIQCDLGLHEAQIKGRLTLVKSLVEEKAASQSAAFNGPF